MKDEIKSPFKRGNKTIQELINEVNSRLKTNTWDGKSFTSPKAGEPRATKDFMNSPNYFEFIPTGKPSTRDNTLYLNISQDRFDAIVAGHKQIEYREVNEESMGKYVDVRESSDGLILNNPNLQEGEDIRLDAYANGIFGFIPRFYEYINISVVKSRVSETLRIKGACFLPEPYHRGGDFRMDYDLPISDAAWEKAEATGHDALQDLLYRVDGPDTTWFIGYLIEK